MQITNVALGLCMAILWGLADPIATLSARRLTTLSTTLISQVVGLFAFTLILLIFFFLGQPIFPAGFLSGSFAGALAGIWASIGYFAFYYALEIGPVAIISPLSSASVVVTLVLSVTLLGESIRPYKGLALIMLLLGVMLASTHPQDLFYMLKKRAGGVLWSRGVRWTILSILAFGCMDFLIGAGSISSGWIVPVFWMRFWSVIIFSVFFFIRRYYSRSDGQSFIRTISKKRDGLLLAMLVGSLESGAIVAFSIAAQLMMPGATAAIACSYSLVAVLFGVIVFRERLVVNQLLGIGLVIGGLMLLTISP